MNIFVKIIIRNLLVIIQILLMSGFYSYSQIVSIENYSINLKGQVQLEINSSPQYYYLLNVRHHPDSIYRTTSSLTLGKTGTTFISEPLGYYPLSHYQVLEFPIQSPADFDGDGIDDISEYTNFPLQSPLNAAESIAIEDGLVGIDNIARFDEISVKHDTVQWNEYLNGKSFVKYLIVDFFTDQPKIYFINSKTYNLHINFTNVMGINYPNENIISGHIIYHPTIISANSSPGTFAFNFTNANNQEFKIVQKTHELLAANMPFLENNFSYFIHTQNEDAYAEETDLYQNSRIPALFETDVYAETNYWGLNQAEGYGYFRKMTLDEIPGPRDIVLYESIPNSLPLVGGIMTSYIQTPLSHVNLRAIQNNIPNAFIRDPLSNDTISDLLNHYIYYKVEQSNYTIEEATLEEVNAWYENIRPDSNQSPPLNLEYTTILPLDEIAFSMFDGYGAKCANVATMRSFGFPDPTIPNGYGIPFYFYQEFMKFNNFFDDIELIMSNSDFISDREIRNEMLKDFRKKIKNADMPTWIMNELAEMHESFPENTSIRCRSSTNNEDLPGFSGAGLYSSKTQHPDEGHISKSIKQVYASLWNLRAYEEREFYKVNHFISSMGVLCHPNYSDEKVNGVGVSLDPVYQTNQTFYLNSQLGEDLITNPNSTSIPEEILLSREATFENDFIVIRRSNLISQDSLLMSEQYLEQMRGYFSVIHDEFEKLYNAFNNSTFAMDIEYKITSDSDLIIKQARPWVSYIQKDDPIPLEGVNEEMKIFPNPSSDFITLQCKSCNLIELRITNTMGKLIKKITISRSDDLNILLSTNDLSPGTYIITGFSESNAIFISKFIKT